MRQGKRKKRRGKKALAEVIARHVESFRTERGLSRRELAARAGISLTGLNLIETAAVKPTVESLERLGDEMGVPVAAFLDEGRSPEPARSPKLFFRLMRKLKGRDAQYLVLVDRFLMALDRYAPPHR